MVNFNISVGLFKKFKPLTLKLWKWFTIIVCSSLEPQVLFCTAP